MSRGAAITGIGLVTAVGDDAIRFAESDGLARNAGEGTAPIEDFDVGAYVQRKGMRHLSRTSQLACAAAARLAPALEGLGGAEVGVVLGSAWAALDTIVRFEREAWTEGPRFVDPLLFTETVPNVPAGQVSIVFGWSAINMTLGGGEAAGVEAVSQSLDLLDQRRASVIVAGGVDALHVHLVRTLEARGSRDRESPPCGEASCLLALETLEGARARGVAPLGRIGFCITRARSPTADRAGDRAGLLEEVGREAGGVELDLVVDSDGPTGLPRRLGRTWAASGPLGIALALARLRERAGASGRVAHGVVLAGSEHRLSAIHVAVEPVS